MRDMDGIMLLLCGIYCFGMAIFHALFSRLFDWKNDLAKLNVANKAIIRIANLKLIYLFILVGLLCFFFPVQLTTTPMGRFFMIGMSIFWLSRTFEQMLFLKVDHPLVKLLTYLFLIGAILFAVPVLL